MELTADGIEEGVFEFELEAYIWTYHFRNNNIVFRCWQCHYYCH